MSNLQNPQLIYVKDLISNVANVSTMDIAGKKVLSQYTALQLHPGAGGKDMLIAVSPLPHPDALSLLDRQLENEKIAGSFAEEALKTAKESVSFGNGILTELGWSFVESLVNEQGAELLRLTKPFIDKVLDKYIDSYTEPIIEQQAEKVQSFFRHPEAESAAQDLARLDTRSALARMSADETKKAQAAAHQALESAQKAKIEISAGSEDQGVADLINAEQASTDAQTSANFARDASSSLKDAAEASGSVSHQVQIAASVAGATDAGASLRAAAQVEEAIKTTKAAAEIVEDARAARNAAEAAEAAKAILRAIPK
ncbi:hypothetical protein [Granulicella arctica]|uniref:hypothetical protein n=1 Tax=Granulicella arctica TaxID=940613 RepID=UPI0021DFBDE6|nr:hypothetical protein [Granulicella arctica]